jgi:hypothetical protein
MVDHNRKPLLMLRALKSKFEAIRDENITIALTYIEHGVGVGEHPTLVSDAADAIKRAAEAEECLRFMQSNKFQSVLSATTDIGKFFNDWD